MLRPQGGGFAPQAVISTASLAPTDVYAADLDGDGLVDVVSVSRIGNRIAWNRNLGGGAFGAQQVLSTVQTRPSSVFASDLDGDGDVDVLSTANDDSVIWFDNQGGGVFGAAQTVSSAVLNPSRVLAADLDGDGDDDVVSSSLLDSKVAWYENLGGGAFGPQQVLTTSAQFATDCDVGDLDGDGDLDVVSVSTGDDKLAWYENLGGGSFGPQQVIATASITYRSVHATDLDGDGDVDLVTCSRDDGEVAWHQNLGGSSFSGQLILSLEVVEPLSARSGDFDGDGARDIAVIGTAGFDELGWFRNLGGGAFGPLQAVEVGNSPSLVGGAAVRAVDLDADGADDLLTASSGDNKVAWYENWATVTTYGQGCGTPRLTFAPSSPSSIGSPIQGRIVHAPTTLCVVALGLSDSTLPGGGMLPLNLTSIGMPGCALYHSAEVFGLATQPSANPFEQTDWTGIAFPASAQGVHVFGQAFALAPGANALEVLSSNGADWTISP